jgi:hypothetical protein
VTVDTMAVVRSTRAEEDVIFDSITGSRKVPPPPRRAPLPAARRGRICVTGTGSSGPARHLAHTSPHTRTHIQVLSVVSFRDSQRSEARYIRSSSEFITGGTGVVAQMALMLNFGERRRSAEQQRGAGQAQRRAPGIRPAH